MSEPDDDGKKASDHPWERVVDLGEAVARGDAQAVAALIRAGADLEAVEEREDPTVLMRAAEAGNLEVVRALVEGGANVNAEAQDEDLDRFLDDDEAEAVGTCVSALLYAALKEHRDVYDYLHPRSDAGIRRGVERALKAIRRRRKPARDRRPKALVEAAQRGKIDDVRALLGDGVEVNARDSHGRSALWCAVAFKQPEVVALLLDSGADPNLHTNEGLTPLHSAEDPAVARRLLDAGADPDARSESRHTPLMLAAVNRSAELVRTLIARDADLDATDFQGKTALILAAERGMTENVADLIAAGAGLRVRDQDGFTAYRHARRRRHQAVADLLSDAGAMPETTLQLFRASAAGRLDEVERLLAASADVHDRSEPEPDFEMTALHLAAQAGHADVARALIAAGADVHAKTFHPTDRWRRDMSPLMLAAMGGHAQVLRILIEAGARPDATSFSLDGETPLLRAAEAGHLDAVRALLEAGAEPRDALARAERNGHRAVAELLGKAKG